MKTWLQKIYDANVREFGHLEDDQILSLTVYAEARGEQRNGKIAVGSVILERVDHRAWDGKTIQEVCLWPLQFSAFNTEDKEHHIKEDPNRKILLDIARNWDREIASNTVLQECFWVAQSLIAGGIERHPIALDYFNPHVITPAWAKDKQFVATIGNHEFYV